MSDSNNRKKISPVDVIDVAIKGIDKFGEGSAVVIDKIATAESVLWDKVSDYLDSGVDIEFLKKNPDIEKKKILNALKNRQFEGTGYIFVAGKDWLPISYVFDTNAEQQCYILRNGDEGAVDFTLYNLSDQILLQAELSRHVINYRLKGEKDTVVYVFKNDSGILGKIRIAFKDEMPVYTLDYKGMNVNYANRTNVASLNGTKQFKFGRKLLSRLGIYYLDIINEDTTLIAVACAMADYLAKYEHRIRESRRPHRGGGDISE